MAEPKNKKEPRAKLLALLASVGEDAHSDMETQHRVAEDLLLELLGDPEVTEAWDRAAGEWWYA